MLDAKEYLGDKFIEKISQGDLLEGFVQFAVDRAVNDEEGIHAGLIGILQEKENPIIMSPEIQATQEQFSTEILGNFSQLLGNREGIEHCLQSLQAVSNVLFIVFLNEVVLRHATELDYFRLRKRKAPRDDEYVSTINTGKGSEGKKRESTVSTSFGNKRTQVEALRIQLEKRQRLIEDILEKREKKENKRPKLTICRKLIKRGVLIEYEKGKFKLKGMTVRGSQYAGSSEWLHLKTGGKEHGRSLDKHAFEDAFDQLLMSFNNELEFTEVELKELRKFRTKGLYK